jgi:KDO2-lipid IV(A) lauroyltransferase
MRAMLGLMWLLHWLPLPILGRLGKGVGTLLFWMLKERRKITLTNLRLCLPHVPEAERHRIAKEHFQAYARSIFERALLWWAPESRLKKLIVLESPLPVEEISSRPTILLCPHFVCLDVAGTAIAMRTPGCSIYTSQRNKVFDQALRKGRQRFHPVTLLSREKGIKPILRAVKQGLPFFMLPDMDFGRKDAEFVSFFGVPAATLTAPARIASATGARVIPVIATFLPDYRGWKVELYPEWQNYPGNDMLAATRRMNAFIEERVLEAPSEYFWTHKRFKTRPEGEENPY